MVSLEGLVGFVGGRGEEFMEGDGEGSGLIHLMMIKM